MDTNKAQFRFSTDILSRLGEEFNPNPDQGILELVKNSYDTDSIKCKIELLETSLTGGTIHIIDDVDGMDIDGIKNGWLLFGKSNKLVRGKSSLGRILAGSKGLGRLAALKMRKNGQLTMQIVQAGSEKQSILVKEFHHMIFENLSLLEDEITHIKATLLCREKASNED